MKCEAVDAPCLKTCRMLGDVYIKPSWSILLSATAFSAIYEAIQWALSVFTVFTVALSKDSGNVRVVSVIRSSCVALD